MRGYKKYDNHKIDWLENTPSHWKMSKLKFDARIDISTVDRHELEDEVTVSVCHYPQAYNNEKINRDTVLSTGTCSNKEFEKFKLKKGQIIITKDSETSDDIGVPTFVEEDIPNAVCGYHLAIIDVNEKKLYPSFLFRYLQSKNVNFYFDTKSNGVTRFGLGKPAIENLPVPIPPINEQIQIARYLDHHTYIVNQLINQKEKLNELLRHQRQSLIFESLTKGIDRKAKVKRSGVDWIGDIPINWEVKKLKFIFKIKKHIAGKLGYSVLSVTQKGIRVRDTDNFKGQLSMDYSKYQLVEVGDFVMNHMDLLTGYIDISKFDGVTSPDYRVFRSVDESINNQFYLYLFQYCYHNRIFYGQGQGVSQLGRWRMSSESFNDFLVPFPSRKEQDYIVNYIKGRIANIDSIMGLNQDIIEKMSEYRLALISEAVTGRIDVRNWQPQTKNVA